MGTSLWKPTVAVSALIWRGDDLLILHRVRPPLIWVPPGGRVEAGESPYAALRREVREETALRDVHVVAPCIIEAGMHDGHDILFLDYVCLYAGGDIALDRNEHDAWQWVSLDLLETTPVMAETAPGGESLWVYELDGGRLALSHSLEQLRFSRRILGCLIG
jgi:8-oxo-dGTP pyrophosphatase MutT (NUDIX family)